MNKERLGVSIQLKDPSYSARDTDTHSAHDTDTYSARDTDTQNPPKPLQDGLNNIKLNK